ncbi:MAG TPA: condensation domain-containing protein [Aldersonia sp.]
MTVEEAVARIWCDVLGVQRVAPDADLLDLGGDEVTAGWIAGRIRRAFPACTVTGRDVMVDAPTVSSLAALVDASRPPLEISSQQEALLARSRIARVRGIPMRPFTVGAAVEIIGRLDVEALRVSLAQIVARHAPLRTSYCLDGAWRVVLNEDVPAFALPVVDLLALPAARRDAAVTAALVEAANTVFHPDDPVRLRAQLLRTGDDRYVLGLVLDHLVADGSSIDVLYAELSAGYAANRGTEPVNHAFFEFVAEQRRWSVSPECAAEITFWRDTLGPDGVHGDMPLPFERAVDAGAATVAHTIGARLPPETVARLDAAARQTRSTRFRVVLAALSVVLNRVTGRDTVTISSPDANRSHPGAADAIGWYAHVVLYRCDLSGDPDLDQVMNRVRHTFTQAQAHKHLPYRDLTRALSPDTFGLPRTATWVSLVAVDTPVLELTGLRCRPRNIPADAPNRALEVELEDHHDGAVELRINFDAYRFDESAVADLFDRILLVVGRLAEDRSIRLSALPSG